MQVGTLLELACDLHGDRVALGPVDDGVTYAELHDRARGLAELIDRFSAPRLMAVDLNSEAIPVCLFGAALAGVPFVPVNYRLADDRLAAIAARTAPALVVAEASVPARLGDVAGLDLISRDAVLSVKGTGGELAEVDVDDVAVLLYTSGTTGEPKAAVLRHRHLTGYVLGSVELSGAAQDEAALVSVPPYHVAAVAAVLSSVWAGRRVVYLEQFDADAWVKTVRAEAITHTMVVPTMLCRILEVIEADGASLPSLRHLSYGGGRMPASVVERAINSLPGVGLVNAYGLTETSSTVSVLTPEDHREAYASADPSVRARLGSVGRPLPSLELEIRDAHGETVPAGRAGEVYVRGEQVSGEYLGSGVPLTSDGWFATNDGGRLDAAGYLFVEGRLDDVIVRGGENISPGEIEDVLVAHPSVADAAVVGIADDDWGEAVAAVVVATGCTELELQDWVRTHLRSTRCPTRIEFRAELPYNETGKLLRRVLKSELAAGQP